MPKFPFSVEFFKPRKAFQPTHSKLCRGLFRRASLPSILAHHTTCYFANNSRAGTMAKLRQTRYSKGLENKITKFYANGNSIQRAADTFNLSFTFVRNLLLKRNLLRLNKSGRNHPKPAPSMTMPTASPALSTRSTDKKETLAADARAKTAAKNILLRARVRARPVRRLTRLAGNSLRLKSNQNSQAVNCSTSGSSQKSDPEPVISHPKPQNTRTRKTEAASASGIGAPPDADRKSDYEEFIKAFAVPTHLYRYLATRSQTRPLYLTRNLRYMRSSPKQRTNVKYTRSLNSVLERLLPLKTRVGSRQPSNQFSPDPSARPSISLTNAPKNSPETAKPDVGLRDKLPNFVSGWPDEVELVLEGFFDSEKENDWVTVEAQLSVQSRFGWTLRRKSCPRDTLVVFDCECRVPCNEDNSNGKKVDAQNCLSPSSYRFRPSELIEAACAGAGSSCQRLSSGQMELRIRAMERRKAKRINGCSNDALSHSSYLVQYSTAPLPLFYTDPSGEATSCPLLLSPGLYELRLGIEAELPDRLTSPSTGQITTGNLSSVPANSVMSLEGAAPGRVDWCRIRFPKVSAAVDEYSRWPRLRFHVTWHDRIPTPCHNGDASAFLKGPRGRRLSAVGPSENGSFSSESRPKTQNPTKGETNHQPRRHNENAANDIVHASQLSFSNGNPGILTTASYAPVFVTYRFVYGKGLQQWSETQDLICPWCKIDCKRAKYDRPGALLAHLRTCHPRFRFKANWIPSRQHLSLEVSLNDSYDGSNDCGIRRWHVASRHEDTAVDLCVASTDSNKANRLPVVGGWTGYFQTENTTISDRLRTSADVLKLRQPARRLPYSHLIYWRGADRMVHQSLDPAFSVRPLAVGHNRVYYHTNTMQPITAAVFDEDSESEDAPSWLREHYQRKVEEFTDVNKGEKEIMQIWNVHLLSIKPVNTVICDSQMTNLVLSFITIHARWLHERGLRNNLLLHLTNLVDYGLVSPNLLRRAMKLFDSFPVEVEKSEELCKQDAEAQPHENKSRLANTDAKPMGKPYVVLSQCLV
ncbi:Polycomb protein suz12 [Sparganum proliferum]